MKKSFMLFFLLTISLGQQLCEAGGPENGGIHGILITAANRLKIEPAGALNVLAQVESGVNPLAIHLSSRSPLGPALSRIKAPHTAYISRGRYHYSVRPKNKAQAQAIVLWAAKHDNIMYDVGLMQIWEGNVNRYKLDPVSLLDPRTSAIVGGQIFRECLQRYDGAFWKAVECYHHGSYRGKPTYYSQHVQAAIKKLIKERNS